MLRRRPRRGLTAGSRRTARDIVYIDCLLPDPGKDRFTHKTNLTRRTNVWVHCRK